MIPAARAEKCSYHAIEFDATQVPRCPACVEHDKRVALERRVSALEESQEADNGD